MLTRINKHRDEAGFTLIELLVVVIIIGILAAIAIPVFLNQRNSARNASVQSDVRTLAIEAESYYTTYQAYPEIDEANTTQAAHEAVVVSNGNAFDYAPYTRTVEGETTTGFEVVGCNWESGVVYVYDSALGGLQDADTAPQDVTFSCPTVDPAITEFSLTSGGAA